MLLARKLGRDHSWLAPFERPLRNELSEFDHCFDGTTAQAAIELVATYKKEIARLPPALYLNGYFGPGDVAFYWAFIRSRRSATVIEVGSGYSSRVALRALIKNRHGRTDLYRPISAAQFAKPQLDPPSLED